MLLDTRAGSIVSQADACPLRLALISSLPLSILGGEFLRSSFLFRIEEMHAGSIVLCVIVLLQLLGLHRVFLVSLMFGLLGLDLIQPV